MMKLHGGEDPVRHKPNSMCTLQQDLSHPFL